MTVITVTETNLVTTRWYHWCNPPYWSCTLFELVKLCMENNYTYRSHVICWNTFYISTNNTGDPSQSHHLDVNFKSLLNFCGRVYFHQPRGQISLNSYLETNYVRKVSLLIVADASTQTVTPTNGRTRRRRYSRDKGREEDVWWYWQQVCST